MTDLADLQRRIEKLEARAEIAELASAYAVACDEHDMARLLGLFTEDARFDSPSKLMMASGRAEIEAMFIRMFKVRGPGYHWTHDLFVTPDPRDPNRATGRVLSHAETCPNEEGSLAAMRYDDDYRRVDGRWLFARRTINFLYYVPVRDYAQVFSSPARVTVGGTKLPADYPENLPAWQAFERQHRNG
ncbi:MAG TPA: nuclear transport factor 2 family protein [Ramlibacter sp.]|nr:nuclear transport factor 2 family protein [Ramlibacter sp.]